MQLLLLHNDRSNCIGRFEVKHYANITFNPAHSFFLASSFAINSGSGNETITEVPCAGSNSNFGKPSAGLKHNTRSGFSVHNDKSSCDCCLIATESKLCLTAPNIFDSSAFSASFTSVHGTGTTTVTLGLMRYSSSG